MPDPAEDHDIDPIRASANPTIDVVSAGLRTNVHWQPAWVRMTEVLVRWLRFHFSAESRIEHPDLIGRVWTAQPSSPIFISSLAEWAPNQSQERPAVLVDRLDQDKEMNQRGIGDQLQGIKPGQFAHFMNGQHVVHCLGGRDGEAEAVAFEVWRELTRFAPYLRELLCLLRLLPMRIGKRVQLSQEHKEHYSVPIVLAYGYSEAWRVKVLDEEEITAIKSLVQFTG